MAPVKKRKTALQRLVEENERSARDIDPEDFENRSISASGSDESDEENDGARSHYEAVGKSKLRDPKDVALGPEYSGTAVSRDAFEEEDDGDLSDDPFAPREGDVQSDSEAEADGGRVAEPRANNQSANGINGLEEDENKDEDMFGGLDELGNESLSDDYEQEGDGIRDVSGDYDDDEDEDDLDLDQDGLDEDEDENGDEEDESELEDEWPANSKRINAERELQALADQGSQKLAVRNLSVAAKADVDKGNAVKRQRTAFNALLNTRMRLQKGLVAANTLSAPSTASITSATDRELIESAEKAALALLNGIADLRASMPSAQSGAPSEPRGVKRPYSASSVTPTSEIFSHMQSLEASMVPARRATLNRWAQKTGTASIARPAPERQNRIIGTLTATQAPQAFASVLDAQLSGSSLDRLVARTRLPRSCAPVQAAAAGGAKEDPVVYDDADWYAQLLRDLVESKMGESNGGIGVVGPGGGGSGSDGQALSAASVNALRRQAKTRRANVDVRASKGRKLRYTVQERLQNFMAPDDRSTWEDKQAAELFGSLFGRRVRGGLDEDDATGRSSFSEDLEEDNESVDGTEEAVDIEGMGGLKLFAG